MGEGVVEITDAQAWEREVLRSPGLVMVVFWAKWCAPCMKLLATIDGLSQEPGWGVKIVRLNVDGHPRITSENRISIVPTTAFFRNGKKLREMINAVPAEQLAEAVAKLQG